MTDGLDAPDPLAVRVLFTTLPATGHFNSLVPLALAEDRYRTNARAFAGAMAAPPPIGHAVALLERLARDARPIPRSVA